MQCTIATRVPADNYGHRHCPRDPGVLFEGRLHLGSFNSYAVDLDLGVEPTQIVQHAIFHVETSDVAGGKPTRRRRASSTAGALLGFKEASGGELRPAKVTLSDDRAPDEDLAGIARHVTRGAVAVKRA